MGFSEFAVYTILSPEPLGGIARKRQPVELRETKRWVTAKRLFDAARATGEDVPILYADAANDCSRLIYWGLLTALEVDDTGTRYTVAGLTPLEGHRTQELVLRSTEQTIAEGYLRPYAIVRTPAFLPHPEPDGPVTAFMFGYWGNGSATAQLVEAIDAAEQQRGFDGPLWVDVRIQRSVRAIGFRDDAMARLLGHRYVWMRDLGNMRVQEGEAGIQIRNPAAVEDLLNLVVAQPRRRVIFFCACERPSMCHRYEVGRLLLRAARRRGVEGTVVEWPGGEPQDFEAHVLAESLRKVGRGAKTMRIPASMSIGTAAAVPWGSRLVLRAGAEAWEARVGPARFDAYGAHLPVLAIQGHVERYRREHGYARLS